MKMTSASDEDGKGKVRLKRVLSVVDATAVIVCTIIGAGIFVSPKNVLFYAGSPAAALGVWLSAGVVCSVFGKVPNVRLLRNPVTPNPFSTRSCIRRARTDPSSSWRRLHVRQGDFR